MADMMHSQVFSRMAAKTKGQCSHRRLVMSWCVLVGVTGRYTTLVDLRLVHTKRLCHRHVMMDKMGMTVPIKISTDPNWNSSDGTTRQVSI